MQSLQLLYMCGAELRCYSCSICVSSGWPVSLNLCGRGGLMEWCLHHLVQSCSIASNPRALWVKWLWWNLETWTWEKAAVALEVLCCPLSDSHKEQMSNSGFHQCHIIFRISAELQDSVVLWEVTVLHCGNPLMAPSNHLVFVWMTQ